jgi:hypothetical protein
MGLLQAARAARRGGRARAQRCRTSRGRDRQRGDFVRRETERRWGCMLVKKSSIARRTIRHPFRLCPFDCKPADRSADGGTAAHQQCKVKGRTRCAAAALAAWCIAACRVRSLLTPHNDNGPNTRHFNIGNTFWGVR